MRFGVLATVAAFLVLTQASLAATPLRVRSDDFSSGHAIPLRFSYDRYGCIGQNLSPEIRWSGAPIETKSFALTVYDPDARHGAGWWHWVMYDIPPNVRALARGAGEPSRHRSGAQATSSFETKGYGGPCPPPGDAPHHYVFTLYALNVRRLPGANTSMTGPQLEPLLHRHELAYAQLTGRFGRPKRG
ncbi:MAG: YbhB/YbcL family Raf kinase inhibitor-like protein [Candidatus Eremiobacteraeota bacterium]|nr:YbhB/YbcL family Raf kinase inhibitor-like protein [Candidatus Eremiobacteraeota bacterium]